MKPLRIAILILFVFCVISNAMGSQEMTEKWGNLIDVAYKFSWYPKKNLQDLIQDKSSEYGGNLEEYVNLLKKELIKNPQESESITEDSFVYGKDWKEYLRLAVSQFCLYLANDDVNQLKNAKTTIAVLSGKMELSNVAFWNYLFQAYMDLEEINKDGFVSSTYQIWQTVILQVESEDLLMMGSTDFKTEFVRNLDFLYENLAHLIIRRAIIEKQMPDLYPLGVIILSFRDKLKTENGYKNIIESAVERMDGLKSDNSNLNFAVALVEATANQYEFEDEKSEDLITQKYQSTDKYYDLALSWTDTKKGRAAILTQRMGFLNYILRRFIDEDPLIAKNKAFQDVPNRASQLVSEAFSIYDEMWQVQFQNDGFKSKGFKEKNNYIMAMQQLWDSSSRLLMMKSAYYKLVEKPDRPEAFSKVEDPLLQYLSMFKKYTREKSELVPDNAFYLAAYSAKELGDMYNKASMVATKNEMHNLAFEYQLQAIELFPLDIMGILQLAHHSNQEGRLNRYLVEAGTVASRFKQSKIAYSWPNTHSTDYKNCIALVKDIIPEIIDKGYYMVKFIQQSGVQGSEDELYAKAVVMAKLLIAMENSRSPEEIERILSSVAGQNITAGSASGVISNAIPEDMKEVANSISSLDLKYQFSELKNELYGSMKSAIHSYLRDLYYERNGS